MMTRGRVADNPMTGSAGSCIGPSIPPVSTALFHCTPTAAHPLRGKGWRRGLTRLSLPFHIYDRRTAWWPEVRGNAFKIKKNLILDLNIINPKTCSLKASIATTISTFPVSSPHMLKNDPQNLFYGFNKDEVMHVNMHYCTYSKLLTSVCMFLGHT